MTVFTMAGESDTYGVPDPEPDTYEVPEPDTYGVPNCQ